ncbi:DUF3037 domain-containing protein [Streptosporangium sp. NPDC051022]|uniref:DUF3037 domain-containing protein n=1 Tax=Streptosporangium sp. NPDC051022 TaxID=3155752 RepID=UPI0034473396
MSRYIYSIVRCLPEPRTGEFVNYGAIAGDPATGDWGVRQLHRTDRVREFATAPVLRVANDFMLQLHAEINARRDLMKSGGEPLGENWLQRLHHDHRNTIQLSPPAPILAKSANEALERIFEHLIVEPAPHPMLAYALPEIILSDALPVLHRSKSIDVMDQLHQPSINKGTLTRSLLQAYRQTDINPSLLHQGSRVFVGDRLNYKADFAIANGHTIQLTQAWSFRLSRVRLVSTEVKAWGYALERLRQGEEAHIVDSTNQPVSTIDSNVDLQVVIAPPETAAQQEVFEEAQEVFTSLDAQVHSLDDVEAIGARAERLVKRL